jgi:uncharacterized membrane protein
MSLSTLILLVVLVVLILALFNQVPLTPGQRRAVTIVVLVVALFFVLEALGVLRGPRLVVRR